MAVAVAQAVAAVAPVVAAAARVVVALVSVCLGESGIACTPRRRALFSPPSLPLLSPPQGDNTRQHSQVAAHNPAAAGGGGGGPGGGGGRPPFDHDEDHSPPFDRDEDRNKPPVIVKVPVAVPTPVVVVKTTPFCTDGVLLNCCPLAPTWDDFGKPHAPICQVSQLGQGQHWECVRMFV